jgi:hypothetical protein
VEKKMKTWKKEKVKDENLEKFLNSLEAEGSKVQSVTMDQATGDFVVIYHKEDIQMFND